MHLKESILKVTWWLDISWFVEWFLQLIGPRPTASINICTPPKKKSRRSQHTPQFFSKFLNHLSFWPVFLTFFPNVFFFIKFCWPISSLHGDVGGFYGGGITGSVLFLENRTELSLSVAPYGTPPEGPEKNAFRSCWEGVGLKGLDNSFEYIIVQK